MVLIGGVKYACERCIRGHRVTTCNHTDQPLIMIKPKGRPSSQCKHCKNMRVNKNSHSSGSCTCSSSSGQNANGVKKKKCGCESGKNCDCHKKRKDTQKKHKSNESLSYIDSFTTTSNNKRVGEVSVPINEYAPKHPQHEIGNVLNEKAVSGFFQDVPLPFEPGQGLLDLFEPSYSSISTVSTSISSVSRSQAPSSQQRYSSPFPVIQSTRPSDNSHHKHHSAPKSSDEFDTFQNLILTPNSTPSSLNNYSNNSTKINSNISSSVAAEKPRSSLFGNYSNLQRHQRKKSNDNTCSRAEVEVLSLTPSFNDIIPDYDNYGTIPKEHTEIKHSEIGINENELKNLQNGKENDLQHILKF